MNLMKGHHALLTVNRLQKENNDTVNWLTQKSL